MSISGFAYRCIWREVDAAFLRFCTDGVTVTDGDVQSELSLVFLKRRNIFIQILLHPLQINFAFQNNFRSVSAEDLARLKEFQ